MVKDTFSIPKFEVEHDGEKYLAVLAQVERYTIGREDHGIFTIMVNFKGAGWDQGISPMGLQPGTNEPDKDGEIAKWCLDYIIRLVDTLGSPENAKGKRVVVFRQGNDGWFGQIVGFATVNSDGSYNKPFWHKVIAEEVHGRPV